MLLCLSNIILINFVIGAVDDCPNIIYYYFKTGIQRYCIQNNVWKKGNIMGEFKGYICPHCGKKFELLEGSGFFHNPYNLNNLDELCKCIKFSRIKKEVTDLFLNKQARFYDNSVYDEEELETNFNFGMRIYYSKKTKNIYNLFYFELEYVENGEKKIYQPKFKDKFGEQLIEVDDCELMLLGFKCPKCKKEISTEDDVLELPISSGCWD